MCMWFGYNPQINFCHFFRILKVIFQARILSKGIDSGYLVSAILLLQFYANPFKTLQMFLSWSEDVHVVSISSSD